MSSVAAGTTVTSSQPSSPSIRSVSLMSELVSRSVAVLWLKVRCIYSHFWLDMLEEYYRYRCGHVTRGWPAFVRPARMLLSLLDLRTTSLGIGASRRRCSRGARSTLMSPMPGLLAVSDRFGRRPQPMATQLAGDSGGGSRFTVPRVGHRAGSPATLLRQWTSVWSNETAGLVWSELHRSKSIATTRAPTFSKRRYVWSTEEGRLPHSGYTRNSQGA